jgi:hypothetical protein
MPSDVKDGKAAGDAARDETAIEPPSVKLIVRLFLIPLVIVGIAVGVMFLIGLLAGGEPSFDEAVARMKNPGGGRTVDMLVGPGSKQRYIDAKTIVDKMKLGMSPDERIKLAGTLIDILDNHTADDEGEVRHFLLLALGRVWQLPAEGATLPESAASRQAVVSTLLKYAKSPDLNTRKAAVLAMVYCKGLPESSQLLPMLVDTVRNEGEDVDVRLAAATVLGPLGTSDNTEVVEALRFAMRDTDKRHIELVWQAALSLAQLNQPEVADVLLQLLDRQALAEFEYYDRETDPKNPSFRKLSEQEQQRILINTMIGVRNLDVPAVREKLADLAKNDPSPRVREAGIEVLNAPKQAVEAESKKAE